MNKGNIIICIIFMMQGRSINSTILEADIRALYAMDKIKWRAIRQFVRSSLMITILVSLNHYWNQEYIRLMKAWQPY